MQKGMVELEIKGIQGQEGSDGVGKVVEQREISGGAGRGRRWGSLSATSQGP